MTSTGSPYARFKRALLTGNLAVVHAAAAELPAVDLADALSICLLMSARDDERYERAAVRWLARVALERPGAHNCPQGDLDRGKQQQLLDRNALSPWNARGCAQTFQRLREANSVFPAG